MTPSILFRCDASPDIGGGHVMRCLTLAQGLAARGCDVRFACAAGSAQTVWALEASGYALIDLEDPSDPDEVATRAGGGHHSLVVDHYGLAQAYERRLRNITTQIVVIDDLADRAHDCDLLVDQSLGRSENAYDDLVPSHATLLAGPTYAMVRPEFSRARPAALARRHQFHGRHVLVSMGLTDIGGVTSRVVRALLAQCSNIAVDVIVGTSAPSRGALANLAADHPFLRTHIDTSHVAELMTKADLAIGAAGTTSWERCCLGLPTVLLTLAENQHEVGGRLHELGAALRVEDEEAAAIAARSLLVSPVALAEMADAAAAIVDGLGTDRIADSVLR